MAHWFESQNKDQVTTLCPLQKIWLQKNLGHTKFWVNENLYPILGELYKDLIEAFTPMHSEDALKMFHLGGDEVNFRCWQKSPEIIGKKPETCLKII